MTPINTAAGSYGRVASGTAAPQERPPAAQATQPAPGPTQRPSTVVNISAEARERAEAAEREAPTQQANDAPSRAQSDTRAAQNQYAQAAAAQNASGPQGPSS